MRIAAALRFQARGTAGDLKRSVATGHLAARGFTVRPTPDSPPLVVRTFDADVERRGDHLQLDNVRATAEGATLRGRLTPNANVTPSNSCRR